MTKSLPSNPSLKHLRLEAKALLKTHKAGDASCCGILRNLRQFDGKSDTEILSSDPGLQEVQFALAIEYGFESWAALKRQVLMSSATAGYPEGAVALEKAVTMMQRMVAHNEHGPRGHISHYLFALRAAGYKVDATSLMALSGVAFSFWYCHNNYHVAYSIPDGWEERIARGVGSAWEWTPQGSAEAAWLLIKDSVDTGRVVWGEYMEGITFAGYAETQDPQSRQVYAFDPIFVSPAKWWSWSEFEKWWNEWGAPFPPALGRHAEAHDMLSEREAALEVLRLIPEWSKDDHPDDLPEARFGLPGILRFADDIANMEAPDDYIDGPWRACHAINPQWEARQTASDYLASVAPIFDGRTAPSLHKASESYDEAYAAWQDWNRQLGSGLGDQDTERDALKVLLEQAWRSPENRSAGATALRRAAAAEANAIEHIRQALSTLDY